MESFKTYLEEQKLATSTIKNHLRNLAKVKNELLDGNEDTLVKYIKAKYDVGSQQKTIVTSSSKYRTFKELPREKIALLLKTSQDDSTKIQQKNNDELELPDIKNVKSLMNLYYNQEMWRQYAVMFLLLHLQTRNLDLVAKITDNIEDVDNESNWLYMRKNDVVYFRNNYKTKADRLTILTSYRNNLLKLLREGYSPFEKKEFIERKKEAPVADTELIIKIHPEPSNATSKDEKSENLGMPISEAFDYVLKLKEDQVKHRTLQDYGHKAKTFLK